MKKLILFTTLGLFLFVTSCKKEEGCTDKTAVNYNADAEKDDKSCLYYSDLIIGSWKGKTIEVSVELSEEMTQVIIQYLSMMNPEDFEFEFDVPMPTTQDEWLIFVEDFTNQTEDITGETIEITETTISIDGQPIEYEFTSNETFEIHNTIEDLEVFNITYFNIETCTKTDLVLVSQIKNYLPLIDLIPLPPNSEITGKLTITCTK